MKASFNWLSELVEIDLPPEDLADRLTMAGLEVEGCSRVGEGLKGVVVGKIVSLTPHPQADQLILCQVDIGSEVVFIVCGAANIRSSQYVPVALPGAVLPSGARIGRAEIRGEPSVGMLCSEFELGLGEDAAGIMILPENGRLGQPISAELALEDSIFDISITPNRGDCLSILGLAREVAAILGKPLRDWKEKVEEGEVPIESLTSIQIEDEDLCGRYAARLIQGITIAPSPLWMRWRLKMAGIRPIGNVVDVTNYVMMERGQPLHAFDFERLKGRRILVRRARKGEALITLDGVKRQLSPEMLVIADAEEAVAIAGVMGGSTSEVSQETRTILLESAWFDPVSIRRTSKALGLQSEASYRFERRVDPEGASVAADRAIQLMAKTAGGQVARGVFDVYPRRYSPPQVSLRTRRSNLILGTKLDTKQIIAAMEALQFSVVSQDRDEIRVAVPSFRGDVCREIDLIEEVARIHGFGRIPTHSPRGTISPGAISPQEGLLPPVIEGIIRRLLVASGFFEAINFSFTRPDVFDKLRLHTDHPLRRAVRLRNPLSEEHCILRTLLLPSLLEDLHWNENRNIRSLKIFEIARTFHPLDSEPTSQEKREMAAIAVGHRCQPYWNEEEGEVDFFLLKGMVEGLGQELGLTLEWEPSDLLFLHPRKAARIASNGRELGWIGQVHPEVAEAFGLGGLPYGFGLTDLDLIASLAQQRKRYSPLPKFPSVVRDLALMVPSDLLAQKADELIRRAGGNLVGEVKLFDVYQGEKIPAGYKSLAFSVHYRAADRTLTDEEVNEVHSSLLQILQRDLGAKIR